MNNAYWLTAGVVFFLLFLVIVGAINNMAHQRNKALRKPRPRRLRNGDSLRIGE
jgi:hypothetical protein